MHLLGIETPDLAIEQLARGAEFLVGPWQDRPPLEPWPDLGQGEGMAYSGLEVVGIGIVGAVPALALALDNPDQHREAGILEIARIVRTRARFASETLEPDELGLVGHRGFEHLVKGGANRVETFESPAF